MPFIVDSEGNTFDIFDVQKWGLSLEAIANLAKRMRNFWERYADCFRTKTRDTSDYAYRYLGGLLRMESKRNFANVGRKTGVAEQNMHHLMSNSPWSAQAVMKRIQEEIAHTPQLQKGGVIILDESANKKSGEKSAGAGRQYNGRLGKIDMSQVGTFLGYANLKAGVPIWTWIDGELFLPEHWFTLEMAQERRRLGLPPKRRFQTKIKLGWKMIKRTQEGLFPFEAVGCDEFYGRSAWLRHKMDRAHIVYMADVPKDTKVYLQRPQIGVPQPQTGHPGRPPTRPRVLSPQRAIKVELAANQEDTHWEPVYVRPIERGDLCDRFGVRRVWTVWNNKPFEQWLVIRQFANGERSYSLSNAPIDTSIERLAWLKSQRFFVEQANREAKSEIGWDEMQAQKYRAWEHHLALTILACWFIAQTKLDWAYEHPQDPGLALHFQDVSLPKLSMANVRELLRAVMPLPRFSYKQAADLVVKHLVRRTRSRQSRIRKYRRMCLI